MVRTTLALLLLAALPSAAQTPPEDTRSEETFFESIDVQVVNVEVFVTDRQGHRVSGLTRDDFEVLENGQPVEVTNFYAVNSEAPAGEPAAPEGNVTAAAVPAKEAPGELPAEQRLHLAIVIDDLTLSPQNRNRLLQSIERDVLPRLRPDDFAMVAAIDGGSLRILQGLTARPDQIRTALDEAAKNAPQGTARRMEKRELLNRIESVGLGDPQDPGARLNQGMVEAVYLGGGLSVRPGEALFQAWQEKFGTAARARGLDYDTSVFDGRRDDLSHDFQDLVEHANANRVTFYTVGATEELAGVSAESGFT